MKWEQYYGDEYQDISPGDGFVYTNEQGAIFGKVLKRMRKNG